MTNEPLYDIHEQASAEAFNRQSAKFDELYASNIIIQYKRQRVRDHVRLRLSPPAQILELNAGTGEDAVYFARHGYRVHATDISAGMQEALAKKLENQELQKRVTLERCSFHHLDSLHDKGPYDLIFSNFAGLNCSGRLGEVLDSFAPLLKPGGMVTLVILPRFCLWETLMLFRGYFKTAFRRFPGKKPVTAHIEGAWFQCWYYNPSFIIQRLNDAFELTGLEGLCTIVPPSYIERFAEHYPRLYRFLEKKENRFKSSWPWKYIGDYYIISFRKRS